MARTKRAAVISILVTLTYASGIVAAVDAVMSARTAQGAIARSVSLVSLPFITVPAYLVFGRSKFNGTVAAYEERQDDILSTIGTANFDNRSFRLNFEVTALIIDGAFAQQVEAMLEQDFAHAEEIDPADFATRPFWWRLGVNASRLAPPVL